MRSGSFDPRFDPSRRQALKTLLAACAAGLAGCTPLRIGLHAYPNEFKTDAAGSTRASLGAFAGAVVPGGASQRGTADVMLDPFFGFAPYAGYFASELDRLARRRFDRRFTALDPTAQREIVAAGLGGGAIESRLFTGAVFLAQVVAYAGVHDDAAGSPLLDFPGAIGMPAPDARRYADCETFRATQLTVDGNPA